jgi:hypothetical protein
VSDSETILASNDAEYESGVVTKWTVGCDPDLASMLKTSRVTVTVPLFSEGPLGEMNIKFESKPR